MESFCCLACVLSTPTPRLLLTNPKIQIIGLINDRVKYENILTSVSEMTSVSVSMRISAGSELLLVVVVESS